MDTLLDPITDVQERIVSALAGTKQPVTNAIGTVVDFVLDRIPEVPALPYAEVLPTPLELIDNQAKFASKVVSTSKSVAVAAAKAASPLTDQLLDREPVAVKKVAKSVAQAA
jgi:hypothetical protein